jgi:hypothetical protein
MRYTFSQNVPFLIIQLSYFYFLGVLGFDLMLEPLYQPYFCDGLFRNRVLQTIWPGWLRTVSLLISASRVARITGIATGAQLNYFFKVRIYSHKHTEIKIQSTTSSWRFPVPLLSQSLPEATIHFLILAKASFTFLPIPINRGTQHAPIVPGFSP